MSVILLCSSKCYEVYSESGSWLLIIGILATSHGPCVQYIVPEADEVVGVTRLQQSLQIDRPNEIIPMPFPCFPRLKRCCWCTRYLRVACVFIVLWSMLATCHSCGILLWPACPTQYTDESNPLFNPSLVFMWILFVLNMLTATCSFGFLLTLLFKRFLSFAETFVSLGLLSAFFMLCHGVITLTMFFTRYKYNFDCWNPSDGIVHIIYFIRANEQTGHDGDYGRAWTPRVTSALSAFIFFIYVMLFTRGIVWIVNNNSVWSYFICIVNSYIYELRGEY